MAISKAAEKAKIPAVCVIQLICAGFLQRVVRVDGASGIEGLKVCPAEVKAASRMRLVGMTASEAFAALDLNMDAGWGLVDRHPEEVSLAPCAITGARSDFTITRFLPESITAFAERFTAVRRVADMRGLRIKEMKALLEEVRVKPVLARDQVGADFYRRSDIANVLPS